MSESTTPLTPDEQVTLKKAAFGAIQLLALADPGLTGYRPTKEKIAGTMVLTRATGIIGHILDKGKIKLKGTTAEVADEVLPALTATVDTLRAKAPGQDDEFRKLVTTAIEQAARSTRKGRISPAQAEMIDKISTALGVEK